MGFIKHIPFGTKRTKDITTTTDRESQLWQEFTMLRHIPNGIYGKQVIAPYIDQAKTYYLDARSSNWKSAGLLYYYSFLNLAKAFIVTKRAVPASYLKSTSIYHGLQASPQNPANIVDFTINIHPPVSNNKKNIFSLFYEKYTGHKWPFTQTINIPLKNIIGYCSDISHELSCFYNTQKTNFLMQSIIRTDNANNVWLEIVVPDTKLAIVQSYLGASIGKVTPFNLMTQLDKNEWRIAHNRNPATLNGYCLVRINQLTYTAANEQAQYDLLTRNTDNLFKDFIYPNPTQDFNTDDFWSFYPKATINGLEMVWHPLLSDYLFAFVLSTVLRYHPHMLSTENQNSFTAEAWCNQSPVTSLRYFLMSFTYPPLRVN